MAMTRRRTGFRQAISYARPYVRAAAYGVAARRAVIQANRYGQSFTRRGKRQTSGQGITDHFDRRTIYRKRNMPRGKKRRWRQFANKVHAVSEKDLGSRTALFNDQVSDSITAPVGASQGVFSVALYPNTSTITHLNDIKTILTNDTNINTTGKATFKSAVLDLTCVNHAKDQDTNGWATEVDVYEITANRNFENVSGTKQLIDCFTDAATDTPNIGGAGTGILLQNRGATPWEFPQALSQYRIKIWKKTKFKLGYLQSFTYQMRDPKRHVIDKAASDQLTSGNKIGLTRWLVIIHKPVPGMSDGVSAEVRLELGLTRKYLYKVNDEDDDQDRVM